VAIISAPRLLVEGALIGPGAVVIDGQRIVDVIEGRPAAAVDHLALDSGILSPGLIDIQMNGCFGVDFVRATDDEWEMVARALPSVGVTAFQPTYITNPIPALVAGLRRFAAVRNRLDESSGAHALGVHVEGPFLSKLRRGVHDARFMVEPDAANLDALLADPVATAQITMLTLAPELPGALEAIRTLAALGIVVSVGHSDATGAQVHDAVIAGVRMVTHIFNAQRGFDHREPGVSGQALYEPSVTIGLIADFEHVSPEACAITLNAAAGRVALVTDAVAPAGMPPGIYELGGQQIAISTAAPLARNVDGTVAGSATFLDQAVRNLVGFGRDIAEVLCAATIVPADALQRPDLGRLAPGARADIVWWNDDLQPALTWVDGAQVYAANTAGAPAAVGAAVAGVVTKSP
jgi:N-acetylglucosamine-6-phosphate deacetylase